MTIFTIFGEKIWRYYDISRKFWRYHDIVYPPGGASFKNYSELYWLKCFVSIFSVQFDYYLRIFTPTILIMQISISSNNDSWYTIKIARVSLFDKWPCRIIIHLRCSILFGIMCVPFSWRIWINVCVNVVYNTRYQMECYWWNKNNISFCPKAYGYLCFLLIRIFKKKMTINTKYTLLYMQQRISSMDTSISI